MSDLHFHRRNTDDKPALVPPTGMTVEQLNFFTEQTKRAVTKATRRDRITNRVAYVVLTVGLIVSLFATGREGSEQRAATIASGRAVAVEGCNRDFVDRVRFRALLKRLKDSANTAYSEGRTTPAQRDAALSFYDRELRRFSLPDCRKSEALLTADPDKKVPMIAPYYPDAPNLPDLEG